MTPRSVRLRASRHRPSAPSPHGGSGATKASRRFGILAAPAVAISVFCQMFSSYELQGYRIVNPAAFLPIGKETAESILSLLIATMLGAQILFIRRLRRATGTEREQMRWFVVGEACAGFGVAASGLLLLNPPVWLGDIIELLGAVGMLALLVCAAVAILRYRLYDVDLVISRSVVFLGLTGFVTLAYAAIVGGVGALVQRTDEPNHVLAIGAAVVVALAFQPVRSQLHRFADRVAYGTRAEPYEVLADLAGQLRRNQDAEVVLARLAQSLTEGTGAARTIVWLRVLDELRPIARYPDVGGQHEPVPFDGGLAALPGDRIEPVEHDGELLGAITLTKRYTDPLPASAERLVGDLAAHAGLLLRNLRLTAELQRHVEELRESRQRLVTAQDAERRRIERDLHDRRGPPRSSPSCRTTSRRPLRRSATSHTGSIHRASRPTGCRPLCVVMPPGFRSTAMYVATSGVTGLTSRPRRTSAVSKRCRTSASTRERHASGSSCRRSAAG